MEGNKIQKKIAIILVGVFIMASFVSTIQVAIANEDKTGIVKGYVSDGTRAIISNIWVHINGKDAEGNDVYSSGNTDSNGYYEINVPIGNFQVNIYDNAYYNYISGVYIDNENSEIWKNITLNKRPTEDSKIQGYVKDKNGVGIKNAYISISGRDENGGSIYKITTTDDTGFYSFNVPIFETSGVFGSMSASEPGYIRQEIGIYVLSHGITVWQNFTLQDDTTAIEEKVMIRGHVRGHVYGSSISYPEVYISGKDYLGNSYGKSTSGNDTGYYEINAPAGDITIYSTANGYFQSEETTYNNVANGTIITKDFNLVKENEQTAKFKGYLKDKDGNPIANQYIDMNGNDFSGKDRFNSTKTDSNGYFEINCYKGSYRFSVYKNGYYPYYEDTGTEIENNTVVQHNIIIVKVENSILKGTITTATKGSGINGICVSAGGRDIEGGDSYASAYTDENGFYRMNIRPGTYTIYVYDSNEIVRYSSQYLDNFNIPSGQTIDKDFQLEQTPSEDSILSGNVKDDTSNNLPGVRIVISSSTRDSYYTNSAMTDANGYYRMHVPNGTYNILASKDGYFLKQDSITINGDTTKDFILTKSAIGTPTGSISGKVSSSGNAISGAKVVVKQNNIEKATKTTDANGDYKFDALLPGDYNVEVSATGYGKQTKSATVIANQDTKVDFGLVVVYGKISGKITDKNGNAISGVEVSIENTNLKATTDENGNYTIENIPVGTHNIIAKKSGYKEFKDSVSISENATTTKNISMEEAEAPQPEPPKWFLPAFEFIAMLGAVIVAIGLLRRR